jgi:biotin synthase-related radical SAM superfamily protein
MKSSEINSFPTLPQDSPDYVRLSLAAAMTLGFVRGWFYRNALLRCINLLLTYTDGCRANCAFCGLANEKNSSPGSRSFIRVPWKIFPTVDVIEAIQNAPSYVSRVCISMITHPRAKNDVLKVCRQVAATTDKSISLLIAPTLLKKDDLKSMKDSGADRIGVAVDGATSKIFEQFRGKPVRGPHRWSQYWKIYADALDIFGAGMAGVHLICGLGETEKELVSAIAQARSMGGCTHLFSFFPEKGSLMENHSSPSIETYRRIQLARWLIDNDRGQITSMQFDPQERIVSFGLSDAELNEIILSGEPFETSGCPGPDGKVACNRPYGNEKPGLLIRNFPFAPEPQDLQRIVKELADYSK